jgi:RHS repeat-associated protein
VTEFRDALGNSWHATYDDQGNLLTISDPEGIEPDLVYTYDGLNNMTSVTDALDNTVTFLYESSIDPTLPTSVIAPADGYGNAEKSIFFDYHGDEEPTAKGMLKTVTDLNGVKTHFYYDAYGQPIEAHEGLPDEVNPWYFVKMTWEFDAASRLCVSGTSGEYSTDGLDWADSSCPDYGLPYSRIDDLQWNDMGRVVFMDASLYDDYIGEYPRIRIWQTFDELGRLTSHTKTSDEINDSGTEVTTGFTYTHDWVNGIYTRTDVETGEVVQIETDLVGRIHTVQCGMPAPYMTADYTYYNNDKLHTVTYGNGAKAVYSYRTNGQISQIKHMRSDGALLKQLDYTYDDLNLVATLSESDDSGLLAVTVFTYDNRGKLRREIRYDLQYPYDLIYTYDQGGNRKTKTDYLNMIHTVYSYDVDENPPPGCETRHNQLLSYEVKDMTDPGSPVDLMTVNYEYALEGAWAGNVTTIEKTLHIAPFTQYCTYLTYGRNGELWILTEFENDNLTKITEFRGRGQRRYMVRDRDLNDYEPIYESAQWTSYDRVTPARDYTVDPDPGSGGAVAPETNYALGMGQEDVSTGEVNYFHNDGLGTTRLFSDGNQAVSSRHIYTAFGEKIMESGTATTRYGYVGAWGYEDISEYINRPFAFDAVHVGHRYYSPSTGRFLQRDPIGILKGLNVYEYVHSNPVGSIDPTGLFDWGEALGGAGRGAFFGSRGGPMSHITIPTFALLNGVIAGWEDKDTQFLKDVYDAVVDALAEAWRWICQAAADVAEALGDAAEAVGETLGDFAQFVANEMTNNPPKL